jgi:hypothetical protein
VEIIMQWLDDLDDLVVAIVHMVERLRWPCLQIGFSAACGLVVVSLAQASLAWVSVLTWVALASLALWAAGIGVCELADMSAPRSSVSSNA